MNNWYNYYGYEYTVNTIENNWDYYYSSDN